MQPSNENTLAAVLSAYRDVLGEPDLKAEDDFFDWGGDSLLAVRVATLLGELTGIDLPVADVFLHSTAAELALCLVRRGSSSTPT